MITRSLSQKFRFFSFVCIALLLFVHGYNLVETYLKPYSLVKEPLTVTSFVEYLFANGLLRFRIPMLFVISGYIFAMRDYRPYLEQIKKKILVLAIPYFIWSAVSLLFTWWLQQYPVTGSAVYAAQLDQFGDYRPYSEIGGAGILKRWLYKPVAFQLWFIRCLFFYNLCYPLFKTAILKYTYVWFGLLFVGWLFFLNFFFFEAQGMLFFSCGVWLYKKEYNIEQKPQWLSSFLCWLFFVGLAVIKTFLAFELEENTALTIRLFSFLHVTSAMAGIVAVWFSCDLLVQVAMNKKWFVWSTKFSFIIYALHVPLLPYLTRFVYMYCSQVPDYRLLTYLLMPVIVLCFCILTGALLRKTLPGAYRVATGGRGF